MIDQENVTLSMPEAKIVRLRFLISIQRKLFSKGQIWFLWGVSEFSGSFSPIRSPPPENSEVGESKLFFPFSKTPMASVGRPSRPGF